MYYNMFIKLIVLMLLFSGTAYAATPAPSEEWNRTFGGGYHDMIYSVQQTTDGGYVLAGYKSFYYDPLYFWLIKTDITGKETWNRTFGGATGSSAAYSVQQTADGGYVLAGLTESYGAGDTDIWLMKTGTDGKEQWNRTFGGKYTDLGYSVQQTADGGYILAGARSNSTTVDYSSWLIKTDAGGNEQWNRTFGWRTFGGDDYDLAYSVRQTSDGGYVLAGEKVYESFPYYISDVWLIKTDSAGEEMWNRTFGGGGYNGARSVWQTSDGGYILAGHKNLIASLIKTDINGMEMWNRTFGGSQYRANSVQQTTDGGYILAGDGDFQLIRTDAGGNEMWKKAFAGTVYEGSSVRQTIDGGYVIAGSRDVTGPDSNGWLAKVTNDTPPPGITNLTNVTYARTYINWTWTDPEDKDFNKVIIYINGTLKTEVPKGVQYYNLTDLIPGTMYTISTRTVDTRGYVNLSWKNHTSITAPLVPAISIITDKSVYFPGDIMTVNLSMENPTGSQLRYEWYIVVPQKNKVVTYAKAPLPSGYNSTQTITIPVGTWGASPLSIVHFVHILDSKGAILAQDSALVVYSPAAVALLNSQADIEEEIMKTKK